MGSTPFVDHGNEGAGKMAKEVGGVQPNFAITCYQKKKKSNTRTQKVTCSITG